MSKCSSQETLVARETPESRIPSVTAKSSIAGTSPISAGLSDPTGSEVPAGSSLGAGSSAPVQRSFATQLINTATNPLGAVHYWRRSRTARTYGWSKFPDNYQELSAADKMKSNCPVVGVGFGPSTCRPILVPVCHDRWSDDPFTFPTERCSEEMLEQKVADKLEGWRTNATNNELCEAMRSGGPSAVQRLLEKTVSEQKFSKVDLVYLEGDEWREELQGRDVDPENPEAATLKQIWGPATGLYTLSKGG